MASPLSTQYGQETDQAYSTAPEAHVGQTQSLLTKLTQGSDNKTLYLVQVPSDVTFNFPHVIKYT